MVNTPKSYLLLLFCLCTSFPTWDQESDAHLLIMFVGKKKERKEKCKQLWRTHGLRTFTNPTWMEIICKRCHCGLWAQLICQLSEGWASKGLNHLSNISGEVSPRPLGQERVINLGPHTGADETGECEGSGGGCFLQKLQCGAWGLPWKQRPEGRPRGPATGTGVTPEIWNQLTMAASASSRERTKGWGHTVAMWQSSQLDNFLNCRMWEWKICSALSLLISHFFSTAAKWDGCFLKVQVLFHFSLTTTPFILPKSSFPSTPPSCCLPLCFNIQLRCGHLDFAGETRALALSSLFHLHHNLDDGLENCLSGYPATEPYTAFRWDLSPPPW